MKLVVSEFISLDGVIEGPGPNDPYEHAGWTMQYGCEELMKFKFDELMASDALLLGRITYEGFASAWPSMQDEAGFADKMNSMPKYVVSSSLKKAEWQNSQVISENIVARIKELKEQAGGDLLVNGSSKLVTTLVNNGLVDEYRLLVYPIVLGTGKRLFVDVNKSQLRLAEVDSFKTGVVLLNYVRDEGK